MFNTEDRKQKKLQKEKEKTNRTQAQKSIDFVKNLLFALIAALLIKSFLIETSRVPTGSMEQTIMVGDFLFVNKFIYGSSSPRSIPFTSISLPYFQLPAISEPERGDIVVFEFPGYRDDIISETLDNYVKRCVGLPGDKIKIVDKVLYINGVELERPPHIQYNMSHPMPAGVPNSRIFPRNSGWNEDNYGELVIPKAGDVIELNKNNVVQWKTFIDREYARRVVKTKGDIITIDGKEVTSYTIKEDYFFMMGDNRDNSLDSRFWGFVPRSKIMGEALMIYWSWNPNIPFSNLFKLLGTVRLNRIAKLVH
ncbi:MAG: signal peptidase I [Melioribacteraceae bacterium]|nr:signal peptidase I [Melioribacteraceae bacterium]